MNDRSCCHNSFGARQARVFPASDGKCQGQHQAPALDQFGKRSQGDEQSHGINVLSQKGIDLIHVVAPLPNLLGIILRAIPNSVLPGVVAQFERNRNGFPVLGIDQGDDSLRPLEGFPPVFEVSMYFLELILGIKLTRQKGLPFVLQFLVIEQFLEIT